MQQRVLLVCKIYLFCIYFYLNNFNYPNKKLAIPWKLTKFFHESFAEFPQKFCGRKTKLAWILRSGLLAILFYLFFSSSLSFFFIFWGYFFSFFNELISWIDLRRTKYWLSFLIRFSIVPWVVYLLICFLLALT